MCAYTYMYVYKQRDRERGSERKRCAETCPPPRRACLTRGVGEVSYPTSAGVEQFHIYMYA